MGRRFVDGIWIRQRMQAKDDRIARATRARVPLLQPDVVPFVDVAIVPVSIDTKGVVQVALVPKIDGAK
jgi:hypothetical protein